MVCIISVWYYKKTGGINYINWGVPVIDDTGNKTVCLGTNVNQIYYTFSVGSAVTNANYLPFLYVNLLDGSVLVWTITSFEAGLTANTSYTYSINFNGSGGSILHENIISSDAGVGLETTIIIPNVLTYNSTLSKRSNGDNVAYLNSTYATSPVVFVGIKTSQSASSVDFTLNSISMEMNGSTRDILPGTNQYLFSESTVKDAYMYNAVNNLYSYFFMTNINGTLSNTQILST